LLGGIFFHHHYTMNFFGTKVIRPLQHSFGILEDEKYFLNTMLLSKDLQKLIQNVHAHVFFFSKIYP
jgi:hypothetical protein